MNSAVLKKLSLFISNMRIKYKIIALYFLILFIPLVFFSVITSEKISNAVEERVLYSARQSFQQSSSFLEYKVERIYSSCKYIIGEKKIIDILSRHISDYSVFEQIEDYNYLVTRISGINENSDILKARIYVNEAFSFSSQNANIFSYNKAQKSNWYKLLVSTNNSYYWLPSQYLTSDSTNNEIEYLPISLAMPIRSENNYKEFMGILRLDIPKTSLEKILVKSNTIKNSITYIINSRKDIIAASSYNKINEYCINSSEMLSILNSGIYHTVTKNKAGRFQIQINKLKNTDWCIISVIPYKEIMIESNILKKQIILITLFITIFAFIMGYLLLRNFSKYTSKLINTMRDVHKGSIRKIDIEHGKDEIGEVIESYNYMTVQIFRLMEEKYILGQNLKSIELEALQAQINPHFLYNTLDMINWMVKLERYTDISSVLQSLSKYYKLTLNKGDSVVSIEDEIKHVSYYVELQNWRFTNNIKFIVNIDEVLLTYRIPKITFQPIVENSIFHGILKKTPREGTITINGTLVDGTPVISIKDDGIGMPSEISEKLNASATISSSQNSSGYGLKNINKRIKIMFGEDSGITVNSVVGSGTNINIRLSNGLQIPTS